MVKNRVLRKLFGLQRQEVTGAQNKLHNEKLHDWCCSANIIQVIISRRMLWMGHVERQNLKDLAVIGGY